jgi:FkbM family methyltransferase
MSNNTEVSAAKLVKYKLLSFMPGAAGQKYFDRHASLTAMQSMHDSIKKCAGMTFIDLGANLGEYSLVMSEHAGKVIAFEPDPWTFERLSQRVEGVSNIETMNAAAGVGDGEITLYRHENFQNDPDLHSQGSSVFLSKNDINSSDAHVVKQIDFVRFLRELDEEIGVLKIDIEGAEVELLEALFNDSELFRRVRYVFAETHERRIPEHKDRVKQLRVRARNTRRPVVNLYWH